MIERLLCSHASTTISLIRQLSPPSPTRPDPPEPPRTRPPPCPHRRTSARTRAWRTSSRTYGRGARTPRLHSCCWKSCKLRVAPWPNPRLACHNRSRRLVIDPNFESRGAPVHELDGALRFDGADSSVHVLGHHVAAVHHGAGDVLAVPWIALGHHAGRFEHAVAELAHRQLLMVRFLGRDDGRVRGEHEVNSRIRHQVGLEIREIHVYGAVEAERGCQRRHHLQSKAASALVINYSASSEDFCGKCRRWPRCRTSPTLRCVPRVSGTTGCCCKAQPWHRRLVGLGKCTWKAWTSCRNRRTASPEARNQVLSQSLHLLRGRRGIPGDPCTCPPASEFGRGPNPRSPSPLEITSQTWGEYIRTGVMAASEVVGRIFLPADELLGVKQLPVRASSHLVNHGGFQVQEQTARDMLAGSRFTEEGVEGVVSSAHGLITWHLTIRLHNQSHH